ncbi:MAG: VOC family protein [Rhizobiales bacterium]|nr:VOC family protein [Hyphomicrobiales bacterium]
MALELDHIVVAAADLAAGRAFVGARLGIEVPAGGRHARMGTHNAVAAFSSPPDTYLEVIALDPEAAPPPPGIARWFSFDDPGHLARLSGEGPRLSHWVVRTPDIETTVRASGGLLGTPIAMSRGELHWRIAVRADGRLLEDGLVPTVIEWPEGPHPSRRMAPTGLDFLGLTLHHPEPDRLAALLSSFGAGELVDIQATTGVPRIVARLAHGDAVSML